MGIQDAEGMVTKEQLKDLFLAVEKPVTEEDLDLMMYELFKKSQNVERLSFEDLFTVFKQLDGLQNGNQKDGGLGGGDDESLDDEF